MNIAPAAAPPAFPLKASSNHRYLADRNGRPFFLLGDTPWFLQKLPLEDVRLIVDDRKARGFNTLFLEVLNDQVIPSRDAHGNIAFDPGTDVTRPVEAYWRYADTVLEEAERRGFFVILSDLWYGYGKGLWVHHATPEGAEVYGHFLGKRYARFRNLMWMHVGDRNPDEHQAESARRLARAIQSEAPHHLHTAHLHPGFASTTIFGADPWLDVDLCYMYGVSYPQVADEYRRQGPVRPVFLGETGYEGEPNSIELLPDARKGDLWTPYLIRRNAYWAILSGACGYCAGTRLWRFEPGWKDILGIESIRQAPFIGRLFAEREWWRLVPDLDGALVTAGGGTWGGADHVAAAAAPEGDLAMAYVPKGPTVLSLDLRRLRGPLRARWYDPTTGAYQEVPGSPFAAAAGAAFTSPESNAAGESDFALVLESAAEPGKG